MLTPIDVAALRSAPRSEFLAVRTRVKEAIAAAEAIKKMEDAAASEVERLTAEKQKVTDAIDLMRLALKEKVNVKEHLERFATFLLQATFGPEVVFHFEVIEVKGVIVGLEPRITHYGLTRSAVKNGGGASNMASIGLRVALLGAHDADARAPVLIFDEPASNLDQDKWEDFMSSIVSFAEAAGIQCFLITHSGCVFDTIVKVNKHHTASKAVLAA